MFQLAYQPRQAHLRRQRREPAKSQWDHRHVFVQGNIGDSALVSSLLAKHQPRAIINFAAESHVDRSIHGPEDFIQTNIVGTFHLLEAVRAYRSTYGMPMLTINCSNNYGPYQFPEKLIPLLKDTIQR